MAKKREFCKALAVIAALAMLSLFLPVVAFADNTVTIEQCEVSEDEQGNIIVNVVGSKSSAGDITVLAIRSDGDIESLPDTLVEDAIMYINQEEAKGADLEVSWSFKLRDTKATGDYITVFMGGKDVTSCVCTTKKITSDEPTHTPGDINNDESVDSKDVTRLAQFIAGWDVEVVEAALDVNDDESVDSKDVTRLAQFIAGWDVTIK